MSKDNKIEYIATDDRRRVIPWVRVTDPKGVVTEYRNPKFTNDISGYELRRMDCMDCHNRPSHRYRSPNDAVNFAMSVGKIDSRLPFVKSNTVALLVQKYKTEDEALDKIAAALWETYPEATNVDNLVTEVQNIYRQNMFPEMKADWRAYPRTSATRTGRVASAVMMTNTSRWNPRRRFPPAAANPVTPSCRRAWG